ncbi:carboxypeptidase O-like [Festucalex cinctus]
MLNVVGLSLVVLLTGAGAEIERAEYDYYKYHPMSQISEWMTRLAKAYPDIVTTVEYGKTYELRTITLLKIGVATGEKKKAIWIDCGIHAREWIAPAFCQYFVKQILLTYKTDQKMGEMIRNMDFYITPVLNMDGYVYSWKDNSTRLWRKNRSPGPAGCNCSGTDLNRNFDANWGKFGSSSDSCESTFRGRAPESELEVQAITSFVGSRKNDLLCFLTVHSYGQFLHFPNYQTAVTTDYHEMMKVGLGATEAIEKVHGKLYNVGTSPNITYLYSGSSEEWAWLQGIPFCYTFELRDKGHHGFELPEDQIQPTCEEAYSGALHIITYAHDKVFKRQRRLCHPFRSMSDL